MQGQRNRKYYVGIKYGRKNRMDRKRWNEGNMRDLEWERRKYKIIIRK